MKDRVNEALRRFEALKKLFPHIADGAHLNRAIRENELTSEQETEVRRIAVVTLKRDLLAAPGGARHDISTLTAEQQRIMERRIKQDAVRDQRRVERRNFLASFCTPRKQEA